MTKAGRKSTDIPALVWWEQQWWTTLLNLRQGLPSQKIGGGLAVPKEYWPAPPPQWMTHPGDIHDWEKKRREDFFSHSKIETRAEKAILPELDIWNAWKNATSVRQVQRISRQSQWCGRLTVLHDNAALFIDALGSPRYPRKAKTKDDQRLLYCARVLAGIACRLSTETALDKLRKLRHPSMRACRCVECQNRKRALLQDILYVCSVGKTVSRESVPRLVAVNEPCRCSHCLIVDQVKSRSTRPMK